MALTLGQLAVHIRASADEASVPAEVSTVLQAMKAWSDLAIDRAAPNAPEAYQDMATIVLVGYVYDRPNSPRGSQYANALLNSGALAILKPYLRRTALILDDTSPLRAAEEAISFRVDANPNDGTLSVLVLIGEDGTEYRFPQLTFRE